MNLIHIVKDVRVGPPGFFTSLLDGYLEQKSVGLEFVRGNRIIRPSEITKCMRRIILNLLGQCVSEKITPRQQRIFDTGKYVHKRYLESYIPRIGCVCKLHVLKPNGSYQIKDFIEQHVENKEYWLKGSPDSVIFNPKDGLPYIFELKSIKQELFIPLVQPDWEYIAQVQMYMFLTGIPRAVVFYENKNSADVKEFVIFQDKNLLNQLLNRIRKIQQYVLDYEEKQELPECEDKDGKGKYVCPCSSIGETK